MDCSKVEIDLMNGITGKEIGEHLEKCEDCQIFKDSLKLFIPAKPDVARFSPSDKIDTAIREAAEREVDELCQEADLHSFWHPSPKHIHRPQKIISYLASAACGVLIAWLVVLALESSQKRRIGEQSRNIVMESSIVDDLDSSNPLSWGNVSMDDDFLDVTTDIELNLMLLSPSSDDLSEDAK